MNPEHTPSVITAIGLIALAHLTILSRALPTNTAFFDAPPLFNISK